MSYCGVACGQFRFFLRPQGADRALPGEGPVTGAARQRDPQHFPMCAQARRRFTQVIHMVVHSKACNTFSCRAGRQRVSVPGIARGGRHPGRGSGLGLADIARDGGHRILAARPAGQAARVPSRLPAVTLIVIPPAARLRYAQAAQAQSPPALAPRLRYHDHEPEREAPVPIDDRVQQPITGQQRPMPGHWPPEASRCLPLPWPARADGNRAATDRRPTPPLLARRRGTQPCGPALRPSCTGLVAGAAAPALTASGGAAAREARPCCVLTPDRRGWHPGMAGVSALATTFLPGRIRQGPSMYEMEGPCPASPHQAGQLAGLAGAARRPPGPGTRARDRSPGSSHVPGSAPRWCPFPTVKAFLLHPRTPRKGPAASHFGVFRYPQRNPQKAGSYPHFMSVIHGFIHSLSTGCRV